ncbi:VWA domain-containing protein [Paenibacillus sp. F6_3S_P_1C]|uniref:VWA domain-containing protein n=1 Tax=Paenibacillus vandeheii TaxID=3035917 RepID=A0ABT8J8I3_9BACL|nr:VWA domain-containing protein [Paenibacillus vandeheii]MDN4601403.1 VWA domain-containing protein [Paenibacillus vandeheii]
MADSIIHLNTGQNTNINEAAQIHVTIQSASAPSALDASCFMVNEGGQVPSDDYFVFYNQNSDPHQSVILQHAEDLKSSFVLDTSKLRQAPIEKCVFTATLDAGGTFSNVQKCQAIVRAGSQQITYEITQATAETALIFIEIYKHRDGFKVRAIGRGFFGGLQPLAESFGVKIETDSDAKSESAASVESKASAPAPDKNPAPLNLTKIDLLKRKVTLSLEKKKLAPIQARVAVVFDASGSMYSLYRKGIVQQAFERILAIASAFDDNGELDVWFFAKDFLRAPSVTARDFENYIDRTYTLGSKGGTNNEPPVMEDVIRKYTIEEPNVRIPTYIIFFSDGGVSQKGKIMRLITESSYKNLFWQFVGLGKANYGILEKLDDMSGRFIDNANFFALDDISKISDEELYDRLLSEFPDWIKEAKSKGILA